MPVHKVKGGYKWGSVGKTYPTKAQAERQARAIYASGYRENENVEEDVVVQVDESQLRKIVSGVVRRLLDKEQSR